MKICLAGYGIIGEAWSRHYRADGFELTIWNRTPKPGVSGFEANLTLAARAADVLHVVVADPAAVESVLVSALPHLPGHALVVQSSTISPHSARTFSDQVTQTGRAYVEAPFTGSKPAAEARQNVFYLGGQDEAKSRAERVLHGLSRKRFDIGTVEQAATLKLAMNVHIAGVAQALCESLAFARAGGISDDLYFEILDLNIAKSGVSTLKEPKLRTHDYSPQFSVKHMGKDLRLALETAAEGTTPLTHALHALHAEGERRGWGDDDFIGLIRLLAQNAPLPTQK
jgi:3-hydroxyisobutyrate dehydrogenase-like beta-hydroxyacid dehydrogenase